MNKVKSLELLDKEYTDGEIIFCEADEKCYIFHDNDWHETKLDASGGFSMNLYDINKQLILQLGALNENDYNDKINLINSWCNIEANYYLLYGKEIGYFSLFAATSYDQAECTNLGTAIFDCLKALGIIYSIEITEDKSAIEIWAKPNESEDVTCLYLFNYDTGVVTYGR